MATYHYTSGRPNRKKARWSPGFSNKTRSCLPPSLLPTVSVSPSSPTTSARPYKPTTSKATRCGSRSLTSTGGNGNGHPRSFHSSTKGSTRMQRQDCTITGSGITTRMRGVTSVKTRLGWQEIILHGMGMCLTRICGWIYWDWILFDYAIIRLIKGFKALKSR